MEEIKDNTLKGLEEKTKQNSPQNPEDYFVDGLLYCGKCNTPKQVRFDKGGGVLFEPYCLCKCEKEKWNNEKAEKERLDHEKEIAYLRKMGFEETEMSSWTFDKDDNANEKVSNIARNYVKNFSKMYEMGKGLLLFGKVGTGKTFYSACIANALIDKGIPCLITNFATLVNTLSGMFNKKRQYIDGLNEFDLLVIDDLSTERDTEYMNEIVYMIIDSRYRAGLPLIITTNLTSEELKSPNDVKKQRIYSRLMELCVPIEVKGVDRRRKKLMSDYDELKDILGL